jgi:hypothetical protein
VAVSAVVEWSFQSVVNNLLYLVFVIYNKNNSTEFAGEAKELS